MCGVAYALSYGPVCGSRGRFGSAAADVRTRARDVRLFEHSLVPGLFQTRAYAEVITVTYPETTAEVAKERVDGRSSWRRLPAALPLTR
jgi:hypothetical protein